MKGLKPEGRKSFVDMNVNYWAHESHDSHPVSGDQASFLVKN